MRRPISASALASMAEACTSMAQLKQIHAHSIASNLYTHHLPLAKMLRFAAVSPLGDLCYAHRMFDQIPEPTAFFYNTLIRGYSKSPVPSRSVYLFNQMRRAGLDPDEFSFNFLMTARSRVKVSDLFLVLECDEIHGLVVKLGFSSHLYAQNSLIHLYAMRGSPVAARKVFGETVGPDAVTWSGLVLAHVKAGELDVARRVFNAMPEKDVVSWTAMITAYSQAKYSEEALQLFTEMRDAGLRPDGVTLVSVLSACKNSGDLELGISVHAYMQENGLGRMISLCNALIDMYGKCGSVDRAWNVFDSMHRKSLVTWNIMISAFALQGNVEDAFWLFRYMLDSGVAPDGFTFLALLRAHSRQGSVDEGYKLFESMPDYGIMPTVEHYGCVVDMLGQAGRLDDAYNLIRNMPIPSNDVIWKLLLKACRTSGDMEMGERVVKKLLEFRPDDAGYHALLHDIYIASGRAAEASQMRQAIATW